MGNISEMHFRGHRRRKESNLRRRALRRYIVRDEMSEKRMLVSHGGLELRRISGRGESSGDRGEHVALVVNIAL